VIVSGEFFPRNMIPEPELCRSGADLEKRNRRNNVGPIAPPLPPHNPESLIVPRKPQNPCLESSDRKNLHRELLFNQKMQVLIHSYYDFLWNNWRETAIDILFSVLVRMY
jgi:hypothetical protein